MNTSPAEKEYAKALFMLAERTGKIEKIAGEFADLYELIESNPKVKFFLLAPQLSAEKNTGCLRWRSKAGWMSTCSNSSRC